ncbi:MAG TPA: lytic transglycosylase domain-containing protein [bacterium]|nr:lytic transglycosylase domain-containing protein [bacterium]HPA56876.1 lytic transglycosylase domain-containing protein [bacterium]HPM47489.1 lytic transglycosylase domain-containing protein [bacterium]HQN73394.1 lytic transglycosylase domain-containing protein [bacterium]HQO92209.1 lytic transglycosylase domain-containing protein [bacterium]
MSIFIKASVFFLMMTSLLYSSVSIYYFYDPIKDRYTFTNQCSDLRSCKPLYQSKGEVKHKRGYALKPGKESAFDDIIQKASVKHSVDFHLIKSVIKAESLFDTKAVSSAGAKGLMQLMPATAVEVGVKDVFDAQQNIMGGTLYLKKMIKRFKNTRSALAGYNAGPAAVVYYNGIPPFNETVAYVEKVSDFYKNYTGRELW